MRPASSLLGRSDVATTCRLDRSQGHRRLAAAAGDPVALAAMALALTDRRSVDDVRAAVEIVATRRPDQLDRLAAGWPDSPQHLERPPTWAAWAAALRHLHRTGHVEPAAPALSGPLASEAALCGITTTPTPAPMSWGVYCDRARRQPMSFDELRFIGLVGFVDERLDTGPLVGLDPTMLRPLRGRWDDAPELDKLLADTDLDRLGPWGLAVWWEAAEAIQAPRSEQRLSTTLLDRVMSSDDPGRWWPAVLAFLTDWRTP